jgi:hypothetical protein
MHTQQANLKADDHLQVGSVGERVEGERVEGERVKGWRVTRVLGILGFRV